MANGPATNSNTVIDELLKFKKERAKSFGLARQTYSGIGSATGIGSAGSKGGDTSQGGSGAAYLKTGGDTMIGPIAYFPKAAIVSGGVLDIGEDSGSFSTRVVVTGEGGLDDDINTIANVAHAGQMLYLQAIMTTDLTLKHGVDNIHNPQGTDVVVAGGQTIILQWDTVVNANKWVVLTGNAISGAGDNLGDHTATTDLLMSTNKIKFDTLHEIYGSGTSLVIGPTAASSFISLQTNSLGRMLIADTYVQLTNGAEFRANGNEIFLDADNDTKWQAGTDDVAQLTIGGVTPTLVLSVSESSSTFLNQIIAGAGIDMNSTQNIINANTISFANPHSISQDANGLTYEADNGVGEGSHIFTADGGTQRILDLNLIAGEIEAYMDIIPDVGADINLGGGGADEEWDAVYAHWFNPISKAITTGRQGLRRNVDDIYIDIPETATGSFDIRENGKGHLGTTTSGSDPWFRFDITSSAARFHIYSTLVATQDPSIMFGQGVDSATITYVNGDDLVIDTATASTSRGLDLQAGGFAGVGIRSDKIYMNKVTDMQINNLVETADILPDTGAARSIGNSAGPANEGYNVFVNQKIAWGGLPNDSVIAFSTSGIAISTNSVSDDISLTTSAATSDISLTAAGDNLIKATGDTLIGTAALPTMIQVDATGVFFNSTTVTSNVDFDMGTNFTQYDGMTSAAVGTVPTDEVRLFLDSATEEISVKHDTGTVVSLESGGGVTTFAALDDTNVSSPVTNTGLIWDGIDWVNSTFGTAAIAANAITLALMEHGTQGDVLYYGATGTPTRLGVGTAGQVLTTNGAAANPSWTTVSGAGDKISEGNSSVEVVDAGTGIIDFEVDGVDRMNLTASQLGLGVSLEMNENNINFRSAGDSKMWAVGTHLEISVPSGGELQISEASANFVTFDGVANETVFHRDMTLDAGDRFIAHTATEIGISVRNTSAATGSEGMMGIPYVSNSTNAPSDATVNGWFGGDDGNIGIQDYITGSELRLWARGRGTGVWKHVVLNV
jgi:hypothetical protein